MEKERHTQTQKQIFYNASAKRKENSFFKFLGNVFPVGSGINEDKCYSYIDQLAGNCLSVWTILTDALVTRAEELWGKSSPLCVVSQCQPFRSQFIE